LTPAERRRTVVSLSLMLVGMVLETLGVGLVVPAMSMLMEKDVADACPTFAPILHRSGDPTERRLISAGMLSLAVLYSVESGFPAYFTWWQNRLAIGVQAQLSQRLFTTHLRQPNIFHIQRNPLLIRSMTAEVGQSQARSCPYSRC
jgi:hypothetical protein